MLRIIAVLFSVGDFSFSRGSRIASLNQQNFLEFSRGREGRAHVRNDRARKVVEGSAEEGSIDFRSLTFLTFVMDA